MGINRTRATLNPLNYNMSNEEDREALNHNINEIRTKGLGADLQVPQKVRDAVSQGQVNANQNSQIIQDTQQQSKTNTEPNTQEKVGDISMNVPSKTDICYVTSDPRAFNSYLTGTC